MSYNFKWFNKQLGVSKITMADYGLIFNRASIKELGRPDFILLGFDKDSYKVGIKPLVKGQDPELESYAFPFIEKEKDGLIRLNCKDFIKSISRMGLPLNLNPAKKLTAVWDDTADVLIVDLEQAISHSSKDDPSPSGNSAASM
jgi:hypothetical protein